MEATVSQYMINDNVDSAKHLDLVLLTDSHINFFTIKNLLSEYCENAFFENIITSDIHFSEIVDRITEYSSPRFFLIHSKLSIKSLVLLSIIIKSISTGHKILILGNEVTEQNLKEINLNFFDGVLSIKSGVISLLKAVDSILAGRFYSDPNLSAQIVSENEKPDTRISLMLSDRELQIARMFIEGQSNREICNALDLKPSTISTFKKRLLSKLDIKSLMDLRDFLNIR